MFQVQLSFVGNLLNFSWYGLQIVLQSFAAISMAPVITGGIVCFVFYNLCIYHYQGPR
jgi:hypothetical protein